MNNNKSDRRVKYTKSMLREALIRQMMDKHISAISVKALCDEADINRSTFYAHYKDAYDLLQQVEDDVVDNLRMHLDKLDYRNNLPLSEQVLLGIMEYARSNADLFKVLLSENCDLAIQKDILELSQIVSTKIGIYRDPHIEAYYQEFAISGCISILRKWLNDGMLESPETMTTLILNVLYSGSLNTKAAPKR